MPATSRRPRDRWRRAVLRAVIAMLAVCGPAAYTPAPAHAGTEQFSTFDLAAQEEDDESLIDHLLTRPPREWRDKWEHAVSAVRTSQGCLTSGQWFIDTQMKLRTALGGKAQFGLELHQNETDQVSYDYLDFSFRFPTRFGTVGAMFRPRYDKSKQDFGVTWETGADTSALQIQLAFVFEDLFNNLWEFRQTRVGNASEPYLKHPYEPNVRLVHRSATGVLRRLEAAGTWLTPSVKTIVTPGAPVEDHRRLWGASGYGLVEMSALGFDWEARGSNVQADGAQQPIDLSAPDGRSFRRLWAAEVAARRALGAGVEAELRYLYQSRRQIVGAPVGPYDFGAIDRVTMLEVRFPITTTLRGRVGGMYDRIGVANGGTNVPFSYGTRKESRAFVGLTARFGRVSVHAIEGIELDQEPYDVWLVHDKGFLHLQATF